MSKQQNRRTNEEHGSKQTNKQAIKKSNKQVFQSNKNKQTELTGSISKSMK
jgi:hypothetical protein